jgi:hypothetical protein
VGTTPTDAASAAERRDGGVSTRDARDQKEAREEAVREERAEIRRQKRALSARKTAGALVRFVRGNIVTVVVLLFLPSILGVGFFIGGAQFVERTTVMKWGWGMAALYAGLLLNIPWAKYMAPRIDRRLGKSAKGDPESA